MSDEQLPPPPDGPDFAARFHSRRAAADAPADTARHPSRPGGRTMDRRSWYMPREAADALAAAVEDLHFTTRRPKHVIMAALVAVALDHLGDVRQRVEDARP